MPNIYDAPDAGGIQSPLTTLSSLMALKQRKQTMDAQALQMQGQASQNQSLAATAQADQQKMAERQTFQKALQTGVDERGDSIMTPSQTTGKMEPDPDKVSAFALRTMPLLGQDVVQNITKTQNDKTGLQNSVANLGDKFRDDLSGIARSNINNPAATSRSIQSQLDAYAQQNQNNPLAINAVHYASNLASNFDHVPPEKRNDALLHLAQMLQPSSRTADQQAPDIKMVQGKKGLNPTNMNPNAPGGIGAVAPTQEQGITPGTTTLPNQQVGIVGSDGTVRAAPAVDSTGSASLADKHVVMSSDHLSAYPRPGINAPGTDQQRYTKTMSDSAQHVQDVSSAANDPQNGIGATRYRNDQILDILNSDKPSTGPGMASLNWIASRIPGQSGDAFQKIGHYLAQNSAAIASKMGVPNTNMGSETAAAASGNTNQNPGAIKEITKVNDALNTGFDYYNRGLSKASANGADPSKVPAFKQAFGQNFDVNVLRYDDALRRNDSQEINQLQAKLGPAGLKDVGAKRKILHSLADTGDLP